MKDIDLFVNNDEILTNKIRALGEDDTFNITNMVGEFNIYPEEDSLEHIKDIPEV